MIGASIIFWLAISVMTGMLFFSDKDISAKEKFFELIHGIKELIGPKGFVTNILKIYQYSLKKISIQT